MTIQEDFISFVKESILRCCKWSKNHGASMTFVNFDTSFFDPNGKKDFHAYSTAIENISSQLNEDDNIPACLNIDYTALILYCLIDNAYGRYRNMEYEDYLAHIINEFNIHKSWYQNHGLSKVTFTISLDYNSGSFVPEELHERWDCDLHKELMSSLGLNDENRYIEHCTNEIHITYQF